MSLTRFLNMAQVNNQTARNNYPVNSFGRLADRNNRMVVDEVIPHLAKKLNEAVLRKDSPNVLVFVRALGNLAHPDVLSVFEPYLEGKKPVTDFQRLAMVVAMDSYRLNFRKTARSVLYKIYQNAGERHELRVAAVFQLILTRPDAAMLQRMAEQTNIEPNLHVRAAVKSAIESAAKLVAPEWTELAANARAAAKLLTKEKLGMQYSRTDLYDYVVRELNMVYGQQVSWIVGEDSLLPNGIFFIGEKNLGGFKHRSQYQALVTSIERLTNVLNEQFESSKKNEKSKILKKGDSMPSLAKLLNIQVEEAEKLEGQLLFNILDGKRFITFDERTLEQLPREVRKVAEALKKGYKLDFSKLYNADATTISFPLETGLPFIYNKYMPTLVKANGKIRARSTPELAEGSKDEVKVPKTMNLTAEIDVVYSTAIEASVGFVTPVDHQRYEAGYTQKAQIFAPIRVSVDIDLRNHKIESEIRPREATKRATVLHLSSWPYTAHDDILALRPIADSKDKKLIHTRPSRSIDFTIGDRSTGFAFAVQGKHEKDAAQLVDAWKTYSKLDVNSAWSMLQMLSTPELFELNVNFEPERSTADSAKITLYHKAKYTEGETKQTEWKHPRSRNVNINENINEKIRSSYAKTAINDRRQMFLREAADKIDNVDTQVMEIGVAFYGKGEEKAEYVATVATANSLVGERSRLLVVMNSKNLVKASKPETYQVFIHAEAQHSAAPEMNFNDALKQVTGSNGFLHVIYGEKIDSSSAAQIRINTKLEQTEELKEKLRTSPMAKLCLKQMQENNNQLPVCQYMTDKAHTLDLGKIEVKIEKMSKWTRQVIYDLYSLTRHAVFPYITEDIDYEGKKDYVEITARLTPNMKFLNVTVNTPSTLIKMEQLRVPKMVRAAMNPRLSVWERIQRKVINYRDTCVIDDNKLSTFDNRTIKHELGKTWHVAMHTVHPKIAEKTELLRRRDRNDEDISIFVRDSRYSGSRDEKKQQPMNKDVNIIIGEQMNGGKFDLIELRPAKSDKSSEMTTPRLLINEKEEYPTNEHVVVLRTDDSDEQPLVRAFATLDGEIRLTVRKGNRQLKITYDGQRIKMQADSTFRKNVRGICGTYTGQKETDMKTPDNCIVRRDQDFIATWAVVDEADSQGPAKERAREANKAKCMPQNVILGNVISEQEAGRKPVQRPGNDKHKVNKKSSSSSSSSSESRSNESSEQKDRMCEAKREMILEQKEGMLCFSKRTLPSCPKGCKAVDTIKREIDAYCRSENDPAAAIYRDQIKKGQNPNMSKYETNGKVKYSIPTKCVRA